MSFIFSLLTVALLGIGQQHLKLYCQNHSVKVVLVMQSDALKLRCEIKLSQSTGNQFTRWKNTRGRCLRGVLYFYFLGIYCSNIFGKWTTHSKTETLNLHRLED